MKQCESVHEKKKLFKFMLDQFYEKKKPFTCIICDHSIPGKIFFFKFILNQYIAKRYSFKCNYSTSQKQHTKAHIEGVHESKKPNK